MSQNRCFCNRLYRMFRVTNLNWLLFYKGLLSFRRVFCVLLTPGGFGNMVFQNITVEWQKYPTMFVWNFCCSYVLLLHFLVVGINLSKCVAQSSLFQWIGLFRLANSKWLLFCKGLLSFNTVFRLLLTPGGFGNMVFQNIIAEWKIFSPSCLCVVFRRFLCFVVAFPYCRH